MVGKDLIEDFDGNPEDYEEDTTTDISDDDFYKDMIEVLEEDIVKDIKNSVRLIPEVVTVHKIKIHDYGSYKEVTLHILLRDSFTLVEAHDISEKVEREIESKVHCNAIVHAEPLSDLSHS